MEKGKGAEDDRETALNADLKSNFRPKSAFESLE